MLIFAISIFLKYLLIINKYNVDYLTNLILDYRHDTVFNNLFYLKILKLFMLCLCYTSMIVVCQFNIDLDFNLILIYTTRTKIWVALCCRITF